MSDKESGFRGLSIERVQQRFFLDRLPRSAGRWRYRRAGINADPGAVLLFQFKARVIAIATFLRDEPSTAGGAIYFDPASIRTFDPVDAVAMRRVWTSFTAFGRVKRALNATAFAKFERRLRNVKTPGAIAGGRAHSRGSIGSDSIASTPNAHS